MDILAWIVIGIIAGWLAGAVMTGRSYGMIADMLLGICGAIAGGFLAGGLFGITNPLAGMNVTTLVVAFLGAVLVVAVVRALAGRSRV